MFAGGARAVISLGYFMDLGKPSNGNCSLFPEIIDQMEAHLVTIPYCVVHSMVGQSVERTFSRPQELSNLRPPLTEQKPGIIVSRPTLWVYHNLITIPNLQYVKDTYGYG